MTINKLVAYISNISGAPPGTVYYNVNIPNLRDGGVHPHKIILLVPDSAISSKAIITLHGGSGTNYNILRALGLVSGASIPLAAEKVNWSILQNFGNVIVASPMGWVDPRTITTNNPRGTGSWDNHMMNNRAIAAGYDDCQMLKDLRLFLISVFGATSVAIAGHSNGGMMVNRMLIEGYKFSHYISASGPMVEYYDSVSYSFPSTGFKYLGHYGLKDTTINIISGSWYDHYWYQTLSTLSVADNKFDPADIPGSLSKYISEWSVVQKRLTDGGSSSTASPGDAVVESIVKGVQNTWEYTWASGVVKLQTYSEGDHSLKSQNQCTGRHTFVDWMKFIKNY